MTDGSVEELERMGLTPLALKIFTFISADLSRKEFRPVKQRYVSHTLGMVQPEVSRGMQILVNLGVLERGEPEGPASMYRINKDHPVNAFLYRKTA